MAVRISINDRQFNAAIGESAERLTDLAGQALRDAGRGLYVDSQSQITPVDTGHLKRSWMLRIFGGKLPSSDLTNDVDYGKYVDEGTATIAPRHIVRQIVWLANARLKQSFGRIRL